MDYRTDYVNLHPHDIEDMYFSRINDNLKTKFDPDIVESLKIFVRSKVVVVHVEDF